MHCIAIDAMGGDHAPQAIIDGLALFCQRYSDVFFMIFGNEAEVLPLLKKHSQISQVCQLIHTPQAISNYTKPSQAIRSSQQSSMRLALEAVASRQAQGAVSAGNTGAYLALSKTILKTIGPIDRPAIASSIPTQAGECVMLDLGGMLEASSRNLMEYAMMGSLFARHVLGIENPSVGLLNVGREETKGSDRLQQTFRLLQNSSLNFYGFVEGDDVTNGTVSVIVTDGFTGNIGLKIGEGMARFCIEKLRQSFKKNWYSRLVGYLASPIIRSAMKSLDLRAYNGALWLGLNGVAVKSHGGTDAVGFFHALKTAYDMIQSDAVNVIAKNLEAAVMESETPLSTETLKGGD